MARQFQFDWDVLKAAANVRKHGISFDLARTIFNDPGLLTTAGLEHSEAEERWFSVECASNGMMLAIAYLWVEGAALENKIRMISARKATQAEIRQHRDIL